MTPAQRLARLPGCWRPGMRTVAGRRAYTMRGNALFVKEQDSGVSISPWGSLHSDIPDLTDPATIGCLAAWAREVYGDPFLHATPTIGRTGWRIACGRGTTVTGRNGIYVEAADTEGDAWAAAILAKLEQP